MAAITYPHKKFRGAMRLHLKSLVYSGLAALETAVFIQPPLSKNMQYFLSSVSFHKVFRVTQSEDGPFPGFHGQQSLKSP